MGLFLNMSYLPLDRERVMSHLNPQALFQFLAQGSTQPPCHQHSPGGKERRQALHIWVLNLLQNQLSFHTDLPRSRALLGWEDGNSCPGRPRGNRGGHSASSSGLSSTGHLSVPDLSKLS